MSKALERATLWLGRCAGWCGRQQAYLVEHKTAQKGVSYSKLFKLKSFRYFMQERCWDIIVLPFRTVKLGNTLKTARKLGSASAAATTSFPPHFPAKRFKGSCARDLHGTWCLSHLKYPPQARHYIFKKGITDEGRFDKHDWDRTRYFENNS